MIPEERVLTVPTSMFHGLGHFQGFSRDVERYLPRLFDLAQLRWTPRGQAELDPELKQLIAYVIFTHTDVDGVVQVFHYVRGGGGGESRLHRKRSVGIGGHISTLDAATADGTRHGGNTNGMEIYESGLARELSEEVRIGTEILNRRIVGLINDDESEVGRVHLGVVHRFECREPKVEPNETELVASGFVPVADLLADPDGMETWSAICLAAIFPTPDA